MTATADAALFDALNALSVADAVDAVRGWEVLVMSEPPQAQGTSGGLRSKYGAGGQRGCRISAVSEQPSAMSGAEGGGELSGGAGRFWLGRAQRRARGTTGCVAEQVRAAGAGSAAPGETH